MTHVLFGVFGIHSDTRLRYPDGMPATDQITTAPRRFSIRLPRPLWTGVAAVVMTVVRASLEKDATDNWKPSTKSIERIDGIVALILGVAAASLANPAAELSVYERENRGFIQIG